MRVLLLTFLLVVSVFAFNDVCKYDKSYLPYYQKVQNGLPILKSDTAMDKSQSFFDIGINLDDIQRFHSKDVVYNREHKLYLKVNTICGLEPNLVTYAIFYDGKIHKDTLIGDTLIGVHEIDFTHGLYDYKFLTSAAIIKLDTISNTIDTVYNWKNIQYIDNLSKSSSIYSKNVKVSNKFLNTRDYLGRVKINK